MPTASRWEQSKKVKANIQILYLRSGVIHIEGKANEKFIDDKLQILIRSNTGDEYPVEYHRAPYLDRQDPETGIQQAGMIYAADLPVTEGVRYRFYLTDEEGRQRKLKLQFGKFSRLVNLRDSFFRSEGYLIKYVNEEILVCPDRIRTRAACEYRFNKELRARDQQKAIDIRRSAEKLRRKSKPIWIISDRTDLAGDNGETLFTYLMKRKVSEYDIYFLIEESSPDYDRMKKIGPVLKFGSDEHLIKQAAASRIISSAAEEWVINPYAGDKKYYRDLLTYDFIFLQHGITKDDLSGWLNKMNKNISMFICAAAPERESVIHGKYGYSEDIVRLTGFARYDRLMNSPEKIIAFLPTWRKSLAPPVVQGTSRREYSDEFKDSEYCKFYNRLINDERLLSTLRKHRYKGLFYMHPSHSMQAADFNGNELVQVWNSAIPYTRVFNESALMITDYSSVAMDFAYLKKPVIYAQFDRDTFFETHTYKEGYFDYEQDGFGPVCYDYEETVRTIIAMIEDDCLEPEEYEERVEKFFAYTDDKNCERIFAALTEGSRIS